MDDSSQNGDKSTPKYAAPKDKNCPYCGQAFTSSSLGRHLDLYIKEKNPKPPDGVHDVEAIKKMRGTITRRQARGSLPQRGVSTPVDTPKMPSRKPSMAFDKESAGSSGIPKDGQFAVDSTLSKYAFPTPRWEMTGVINDIGDGTPDTGKRGGMQRSVSRQVAQKAQFDAKSKLTDAMDTARAAELALRELLSSWRAAKQQIDSNSMPFDFDPLSLDFPALTLQCLQPPPTLFSSTQHPTSTSWSVQSPGKREFEALRSYFQEQFKSWKVACLSATTEILDELTYPPNNGPGRDKREQVRKAEKSAETLEKQVNEHLQSAYAVWESLPPARQNEVWILEMARSVGRKHKEAEKMKEQQHNLKQENANLKSQVEQLNRLQQPKEYKLLAPQTFPLERDALAQAYEQGVKGASLVGFSLEDRQLDLSTLVTRSIERWKTVVTSSRAAGGGMSGQRSLDPTGQQGNEHLTNGHAQGRSQSNTPQQQSHPHQPPKRQSTASTSGAMSERTTSANTTAPPSVEETSDQDADAEMEDDDSFAMMNHHQSPQKQMQAPMQQQATLEVPRTRGPMQQQQQRGMDQRFMMQNGTGSPVSRTAMNMTRSMPNMNMAMQSNGMHAGDMGMMQGIRGDQMYME